MRSVSRGVVDRLLPEGSRPTRSRSRSSIRQGKVIRTFTGTPQPPRRRPRRAGGDGGGEDGAARSGRRRASPANRGMNRFTWDMRYPNARDFPGHDHVGGSTRGPAAPPGRYQVRADRRRRDARRRTSRSAATPPCRRVTDADLQAQFALARQISERVSRGERRGASASASMKEQIAERIGKATDAAIKAAGQALDRQADRGRRGDLPAPEPQQPGSAELSRSG